MIMCVPHIVFVGARMLSDSIQEILEPGIITASYASSHIQRQAHMIILGKLLIQVSHLLLFFSSPLSLLYTYKSQYALTFFVFHLRCLQLNVLKYSTLKFVFQKRPWQRFTLNDGANVPQLSSLFGSKHEKVVNFMDQMSLFLLICDY